MNSKRIVAIATLVKKNSLILDIGTDHGYLPIYLLKNNIVNSAIASDISKNALNSAKINIKKNNLENKIKLYVTDGIQDITDKYDTIIISGMGTDTIKHILNSENLPLNIILQSNTKHYDLRKFMMNKGFAIEKEIVCKDNNLWYPIISYIKAKEVLTEEELLFGKSNNKEYYIFLKNKYEKILSKLPSKNQKKILGYLKQLNLLIEKCR